MTDSSSRARLSPRHAIGIVVVLVAAGAVAIGLVREAGRPAAPAPGVGEVAARPEVDTVYYFHAEVRCETCLAIESRTTALVREAFAERLAEGSLRFEVVNMDLPEHAALRARYELVYGTVIVQAAGAGGGWADLAEVWTYIHEDGRAFEDYLAGEITRVLEPAG